MCKHLHIIIVIWLLSGISLLCAAQELPVVHYTTENGLPSNIVYCSYRDSKGLLWFGTDKGLVMYNGIRFETFTTFDGAPDNEIFYILEDHHQRLWIQTFNGLLCYYKDGVFHTPANTPFLRLKITSAPVNIIRTEKDSSITILRSANNEFINIRDDTCRVYQFPDWDKSPGEYVINLQMQPHGTYELYTNKRTILIDTSRQILKITPTSIPGPLKELQEPEGIYTLLSNHTIVTSSGQPVFSFKPGEINRNNITHCHLSDSNVFITTTDKGLFINHHAPILSSGKFSGITQDITGNYWLTTLNEGIYLIGKDIIRSNAHQANYPGKIKFAFTDNGTLFYTNSDNNLYRFYKGKTTCILHYNRYHPKKYATQDEAGFIYADGEYHNFYNNDHLILQHLHAPVPDIRRNTIQPSHSPDLLNAGAGFKVMAETSRYFYALQSGNRIIRINRKAAKTSHTTIFESPTAISGKQRIYGMAKDLHDRIWYNTNDTMHLMTDQLKIITLPAFNHISFKRFYIFGDHLTGITHNNKLIVCSNIYDNIRIDTLPEQPCIWNRIYRLDKDHVLLSSNNQYSVLSFGENKNTLTTVENIFIPQQVSYISSDSTTCYFFKEGKITAIPVNLLLNNNTVQRIFFTHIKILGKVHHITADNFIIPYRDADNISVAFSALSFGSPLIYHEYSISKNGEDNWQPIKGTEINLVSPGYGEHVIRIRCRSASGNYSVPASLLLTVTRPFWTTPWFLLPLGIGAIGLLLLTFRYTTKYIVRKRELAHAAKIRFMKSEYKALNALMNPHFIFNSLNNIQGLINNDDKRPANEYLQIFSNLIRQNMHNVSRELIPVSKEITLLHNYLRLEKLRFKNLLNYTIDVDEEVDTDIITVPPLLIQPLVENAIRHGLLPRQSAENMVRISIYEKGDTLFIEVADNGVGINHQKDSMLTSHQSFALKNIRQRIIQLREMYGMPISLEINNIDGDNGESLGTLAVVTIGII